MKENKYGILLTPQIKLHRQYFKQMVKLLGIQCGYRACKPNKHYTTYTEIKSNYKPKQTIGCIFDEHPTQQTLKKMGWVSELQENASIIHVPYDTPDLQVGCLFYIPSGLDTGKDRLFRVTKLSNIMIYPASISCELVPEYEDTYSSSLDTYQHSSFNHLAQEDERL